MEIEIISTNSYLLSLAMAQSQKYAVPSEMQTPSYDLLV